MPSGGAPALQMRAAAEDMTPENKATALMIADGYDDYDSNAIRRQVEAKGAMPNIPPKANRRWKNYFSLILAASLSQPQRYRAHVRSTQRLPANCHSVR